jgi:PAS domain S-box-containing protein
MKLFKKLDKFVYFSLIGPIITTVSLFVLSFFFFVIPTCRNIKIDSKKQMLTELTNSVISMLNKYDYDVQQGIITKQDAQVEAIVKIRSLRYGKDFKSYFWINDTCPKMIMHPYVSELDGQPLDKLQDKNGKNIFIEAKKITENNSDGFIYYYWQLIDDSINVVPKLSFVKKFAPWGWIIGTGIYVNDINEEVHIIQKKLIIISFIIISVICILLYYILVSAIGINRKREKIASELEESKENYKSLLDNAPDAIVVYDLQLNRFVEVNLVAQKLFSGSYTGLMNIDPLVFFPQVQDRDKFMVDMKEIFKRTLKGEHPVFTSLVKNLEDKEFYCEIRLIKLPKNNERLIRASFIDITLRKQAEELAKKNEEMLINLNADKDRFFSILAHDLRSPFNAIIGFTDMLKNSIHDYNINQIENFINNINASALSTYTLLEDLLLWGRSQSGKLPFEPQIINLTEVCHDVVSVMNLAAKTKNITIKNFITEPIKVSADKQMIKTVLRNLISNAVKFTHAYGDIEIHLTQDVRAIIISISDNGIGIPENEIKNLFNEKQKISREGTANESGSGLGLILCKEFIEKHGGEIWAESNNGSNFRFLLPSLHLL